MVTIISIEGNIGSGKSTVVKKLKNLLKHNKKFIFLQEPVDEWSTVVDENGKTIIEKYYSDQKRYAFSFQMMAFITRIKQINNAIEDATENQIIITERCIFTDREIFAKMLYETHKIESIEYSIYLRWFDEFVKNIDIDAFVYLDISPEICFERIKNRNRNGEEIPIEYLNSLKEYHEEWIYALPEEKVLVLDGKTNIEESLKQWLRFVSNNNNSTSMLLYLYRMIFSIFFLTIFVILFIETLN